MKRPKKQRPRKRSRTGSKRARKRPALEEVHIDELEAIVARSKTAVLSAEEHQQLKAAVDTLGFMTRELEAKDASLARLRKYLFGAGTEKASAVLGEAREDEASGSGGANGARDSSTEKKPKAKGHGRNPASDYKGAQKRCVSHESLAPGDKCPACGKGKVYPVKQPKVLVRVTGMAPVQAVVYELEKLRCNACGELFSAREPPGVGEKKYDESVASMIALFKYGAGLPFNRLEKVQSGLGIPLPASTQWDLVAEAAKPLLGAYEELIRQAAQGQVLHNDDTTMQILELSGKRREKAIAEGEIDPGQRAGIFTSGIVSMEEERQIALFFTGNQHAGENLSDVLARRAKELGAPIQMCDAQSANTSGDFETILAYCLVHARRQFVDVANSFPEECEFVIDLLGEVYENDAQAKKRGLDPEQRLELHQDSSGPLMEQLKEWLEEQMTERKVEPNSQLGQAINYMRKRWEELTLFLRVPGAPLDNNRCERVLKKAILHRKNAYFFKTLDGARTGDLFMSLIHTAELCRASPFDYLVALQRHAGAVAEDPTAWMPWNYTAALARTAAGRPAPQ